MSLQVGTPAQTVQFFLDFDESYTLVSTTGYLDSALSSGSKPDLYDSSYDNLASGFSPFEPGASSTFLIDPEGGKVDNYYPYAYDKLTLPSSSSEDSLTIDLAKLILTDSSASVTNILGLGRYMLDKTHLLTQLFSKGKVEEKQFGLYVDLDGETFLDFGAVSEDVLASSYSG
mmetsp:Transcript_24018/g.36940  ORF Transcript_24018/g.36940 Transcript_24018/m.36940 type:complete len:173 (-) Transcript_24018:646-1164(-)